MESEEWRCEWEDENLSNEESMQKMLAFLLTFKDKCKDLPFSTQVFFDENGEFERVVENDVKMSVAVILPKDQLLHEKAAKLARIFASEFIRPNLGGGSLHFVGASLKSADMKYKDHNLSIWISDEVSECPFGISQYLGENAAFDKHGSPVFILASELLDCLDMEDDSFLMTRLGNVWKDYISNLDKKLAIEAFPDFN